MTVLKDKLFEHFAGSMLGTFIGDALGMPVEGRSTEEIRRRYSGSLTDLAPGRFPAGFYTDDTEMAIGILQALVMAKGFDPALTAARFHANFQPHRGYGGRIYGIMKRLAAGDAWDEVGTDSFGNGSAMRVAPIGFFFYDDLEMVRDAAVLQASITHKHPEALGGAVMQAGAVALAVQSGLEGVRPDREVFIKDLMDLAREFDEIGAERLNGLLEMKPGPLQSMIEQIQSQYRCDIKAVEAVGPAIASFLLTGNFRDAVVLAVNLGGDTDTIGAMAGAIAGAFYGYFKLPEEWMAQLENEYLGRDDLIDLCKNAADIRAYPQRSR